MSVKEGRMVTTVINPTDRELIFKNSNKVPLQKINLKNSTKPNSQNTIRKNKIKKLRIDHMNEEEKREINELCYCCGQH